MPQKLSGGGEGDRFVPLALLADKNKGDFGEIVTFRCRELVPGAATDIKDYYDYCRKEYQFISQGNVSLDAFKRSFRFSLAALMLCAASRRTPRSTTYRRLAPPFGWHGKLSRPPRC